MAHSDGLICAAGDARDLRIKQGGGGLNKLTQPAGLAYWADAAPLTGAVPARHAGDASDLAEAVLPHHPPNRSHGLACRDLHRAAVALGSGDRRGGTRYPTTVQPSRYPPVPDAR